MKADFAVFIGRFQPLHIGHQHVIGQALAAAERVIVLIGSSDFARSIRNPFTLEERRRFLELTYRHEIATGRLIVRGISDRTYNDQAWIADAQRTVNETVLDVGNQGGIRLHGTKDFTVALAGYKKDGSSYYMRMFPDWGVIDVPSQYGTFSSTDIRNDYFRRQPLLPRDTCAPAVVDWLKEFRLDFGIRRPGRGARVHRCIPRIVGGKPVPARVRDRRCGGGAERSCPAGAARAGAGQRASRPAGRFHRPGRSAARSGDPGAARGNQDRRQQG